MDIQTLWTTGMGDMMKALREKVDLLLVITKPLWTINADGDGAGRLDRSLCMVKSSKLPPAPPLCCLAAHYHHPVGFLTDLQALRERSCQHGQKIQTLEA